MAVRKQAKKGNGRGSVRRLPSGKWQARITLEDLNGETKRQPLGTYATKSEADAALSAALTDVARGQFAVTDKTTLGEYLTAWQGERKAGQAAKYAVAQSSLIRVHILPTLGKRRLSSITPRDLEAFYAGLTYQDDRRGEGLKGVKPLGDSMKRQIHNLLHAAFKDAVRRGDLLRNPADVARPRYTRQAAQDDTPKAWTEEEARKFYAVARGDDWGKIFCFMLATGLRIGEALGLRWPNVEMGEHMARVTVAEGLVSLGGHRHRTDPKTARSRRTMEVYGDALAILKEQPAKVALDREARPNRFKESDAVFTNTIGGPILPDTVYKHMRRLCQAAGVPYRATHVSRHSFVSIQGEHGTPVEVISAHVGHAKASFTRDRYRTVFDKERAGMILDFSTLTESSESDS